MPYIPSEARQEWAPYLDALVASIGVVDDCETAPGALNYLVTRLTGAFLGATPNYDRFNEAIGALECAKLELYRRMVAPYEDQKIAENGDVYP